MCVVTPPKTLIKKMGGGLVSRCYCLCGLIILCATEGLECQLETIELETGLSGETERVVSRNLGPDLPQHGEKCTSEGCQGQPTQNVDPSALEGKLAKEECSADPLGTCSMEESTEAEDGLKGTFELVEVPGDKPFFNVLFDTVSNGIWTAKQTIYDKTSETTAGIVDMVREAVHQELYGFLQSVFTDIGTLFSSSGKCMHGK